MHRIRIAAGVGVWLALALAVALATGLPRARWGWIGMGVLFLVVPSQVAWQLAHRHGRVRWAVIASLLVGTAVAAVATAVVPLSTTELERVGDRFVAPVTWVLDGRATSGQPLCIDACPTVAWRWSTDDRAAVAAVEAVAVLRSAGFRVVVREDAGSAVIEATNGRVEADARVSPRRADPTASTVRITLTTRR